MGPYTQLETWAEVVVFIRRRMVRSETLGGEAADDGAAKLDRDGSETLKIQKDATFGSLPRKESVANRV